MEFLFNMSPFEYFYAAKRDETTKSLKVSKATRSWTDCESVHDSAKERFADDPALEI